MKLKLIPVNSEYTMKIIINDIALNFLKAAPINKTKASGESIITQPKTLIPVCVNKLLIIPELANQKAVTPDIPRAININENTLDTKFFESALLLTGTSVDFANGEFILSNIVYNFNIFCKNN